MDYLKHADAGALCAVLFLLQTRAVSEKSDRALGSEACDRATPTRMASIDSLRMTAVEHRAQTQQQQQHS